MAEIWGAAIAAVASVGGALISSSGAKQSAPAAVPYTPVDPNQALSSTIGANQSNLGGLEQLLTQSNTFQQGQAISAQNAALPGYAQFASNLTKTATDLAANPYAVPSSVTDQLGQYAAENNISEGTGANSGFSGNNTLRSLGVNALQYGQNNLQTAMSALSTLTGTSPRVSPASPLSFLLQPSQVLSTQTNNNTQAQAVGQGAANAATAAANNNSATLWDSLTSSVGGTQGFGSILSNLAMGIAAPSTGAGGGTAAGSQYNAVNGYVQ